MTDSPDRDGGRSVGRKRNAAARVAVLQSGPQGYEVEKARLASDQVQTDRVDMTALRKEARQGTAASIAIVKLVINFLTGGLIDNRDAITGPRPPTGFHRDECISPGHQFIVAAPGSPLVRTAAIVPVAATPVSLGGVAGAGKEECLIPAALRAKQPRQPLMNDSTTLTVAPTWHDQRTGENTGTLCASPAHGLQELVRPILFPVAEKQFRLRSQRVQNFRA